MARAALLAVAVALAAAAPQDLFTQGASTNPWSHGRNVCNRIPALVRTSSGVLMAFVSERVAPEGQSGCSDDYPANLVMRRSTDNGATWAAAVNVFSTGTSTNALPVWDAREGKVYVFTNVHAEECECDMQYVTSSDEGLTWDTEATVLPRETGMVGAGLAHGIALQKTAPGRLVGCMRKICRNSCPQDYHSAAFYSDDGVAWKKVPWQEPGTTECQVAELANGNLYMTSRYYTAWDGPKNLRLAAWSQDGGETWGATQAVPELIDQGFACEGSLASDPQNDRVYFVHPDAKDRSNLTLYTSSGNATAWAAARTIYAGPAEYSDTIVVNPGPGGDGRTVGVLYEADGYGRVVFDTVRV